MTTRLFSTSAHFSIKRYKCIHYKEHRLRTLQGIMGTRTAPRAQSELSKSLDKSDRAVPDEISESVVCIAWRNSGTLLHTDHTRSPKRYAKVCSDYLTGQAASVQQIAHDAHKETTQLHVIWKQPPRRS